MFENLEINKLFYKQGVYKTRIFKGQPKFDNEFDLVIADLIPNPYIGEYGKRCQIWKGALPRV